MGAPHLPLPDRLWAKAKADGTGCWPWQGATAPGGYGAIRDKGKTLRAPRVAYELVKGPIPEGQFILHSCHRPECINPHHLRPGTAQDNKDDDADRGAVPRGEQVGTAKLTEEQVLEIRAHPGVYAYGTARREFAERFGVSRNHIDDIVNRRRWGWL